IGGITEKSIAVLPFESLSEDKANAYFATGVQDEILTRLAKVAELKVISRTSTQQYHSKPGNLREIAQQLGVAHILEGSVQKAGESVRVNVQLIKADTDAHLWAETYDRKLAEIFQVQSDIALRIAEALEAKLTGRERREIGTVGTANQQAYEAYLRGLVLDTAQSREETEESLASFRRAVELDPNFALAWAALANRESFRFFANRTPDQLGRARHAMEMALKLQPDASESYAAAGSFYYYCPQDFERALAALSQARARAPSNAFVIMLTGAVKRRQGKLDENIELLRQAGTLDPRNNDIWVNLGRSYRGARKFAEAHKMFDQALSIAPRDPAILGEKAEAYNAAGELDNAERLLQPPPLDLGNEAFDDYLDVFILRRDFARAVQLLAKAEKKGVSEEDISTARLTAAYLQQLAGKSDEAMSVFEQTRRSLEDLRAKGNESLWLRHELIRLAAVLGDRAGMERESEALLQVSAKDRWHIGLSEASAARGFATFGDADRAIPHLERALALPAQQGLTPAYLRLDPVWDNIRHDPRFQKLAGEKP
ncbi:MAG: tetratricopeptide repeat protein, partial [Verrucomicrobiota bacterium]|nr:tetratricopeptide repeat protein [Verrucomicrobiota bacterium]